MFNRITLITLLVTLLITTGCRDDEKASYVKVFKHDQSVQCDPTSGIALEVTAQELTDAGIDVLCSQKGHDGYARIAVCGESTGNINIHQIHRPNLEDAQAEGFANISVLLEYQDQPCD